jgi:hypothetical protein
VSGSSDDFIQRVVRLLDAPSAEEKGRAIIDATANAHDELGRPFLVNGAPNPERDSTTERMQNRVVAAIHATEGRLDTRQIRQLIQILLNYDKASNP